MTTVTRAALLIGGLMLAACGTPPPRPWLRFQPAGRTNWQMLEAGMLGDRLHGTDVRVNLGKQDTRIEVVAENPTATPVEFRMGPEGASPRVAIGEVLLRPLAAGAPPGGPDMAPYTCMQSVKVAPGWRGTFYLDAPLGRDPKLGQYFVLTVEARDPGGVCERRSLPLEAVNSGTMPADGR